MRKNNNHTGLFEFLKASGILETGSKEAIAQARKMYWAEYKKNWAKNRRKREKQVTISLNLKEYKLISQSAKVHGRDVTPYVKEIALTHSKKQYLIPNPMSINYIREAFLLNYNVIAQLEKESTLSVETEQKLLAKLERLELMVMEKLKNPKELEQTLLDAVLNNPDQKAHFIRVLENLKL